MMKHGIHSISLVMTDGEFKVNIRYLQDVIPSPSLEIEGLIDLNLFPSVVLSSLRPIAILTSDDSSADFFSKFAISIKYLLNSKTLVTASSMISIDSIYFMHPSEDLSQLTLYMIHIKEFFGDFIDNYFIYIESIKSTYQQLFHIYQNSKEYKKNIYTEVENIKDKCDIFSNHAYQATKALYANKAEILELSNEFNALERDFEDFECMNCKCNLKNVLFLPCGHIIICNKCLQDDFNITPNLPIVDSRLRCMKCTYKVTQALMSINFINSQDYQ